MKPDNPIDDMAVVIPAYNEGAVVAAVVADVVAYFGQVIVVDDGSGDDTGAKARAAGATVLRHPVNLGQGAAIQTGLDYAKSLDVDYVATFDADGQHEAACLVRMLEALRESGGDIALGSRFLEGVPEMPPLKRMILKAALAFTNYSTGLNLTDTHNGLRVMTAATAARLDIRQNRMAHASEILDRVKSLKLKYIEVPVSVRYTDYAIAKGQSVVNAFDILRDLVVERLLR